MAAKLRSDVLLTIGLAAIFFCQISCAMSLPSASESGCAVVGCGVLGTSLCKQLVTSTEFSSMKVTGITRTTTNHESILKEVGESDRFAVKTAEECKGSKYTSVVFCAPPSGFDDYAAAVEDVVKNVWAGPSEGGVFVFTSSGGIYADSGEIVTEDSPTADPETNPRSARLINAEKVVRQSGGCCLRLAGLYTLERGPHSFWLKSGKDVSGRGDGLINMLHYDDAAGAVVAALSSGANVVSGKTFLISDGHPMTRKEICESTLKASAYKEYKMPSFLGTDADPIGKVYDGKVSNEALSWSPRYSSFDAFMAMQG